VSPGSLRAASLAVLAATVFLATVVVRVAVSGSSDLAVAKDCRAADLPLTAVDFAARAARWYLPAGGSSREGRQLLADLAGELAAGGDADLSLRAWQELRGAILGSRWLVTPDRDLLDLANGRIAREMAARDVLPDGRRGLDEAGHLAFLQRDDLPRPLPAAGASLLFVAWVVVTVAGAWKSVTPEGRLRGGPALRWGGASLLLLACWLILLALA
jgi:hypothetical protein